MEALELFAKPFYTKQGRRLHFEALQPFVKHLINVQGRVLDVCGGVMAGLNSGFAVESSRAALRCLEKSGIQTVEGAIWDVPKESADAVVSLLPTDKGNARVVAEVNGSFNALKHSGEAYFVMHKDQGAKRYEQQIQEVFGQNEVIAKHAGWRLSRATKQNREVRSVQMIEFNVQAIMLHAWPGVYAAGKLDPGTEFLLENINLNHFASKSLLDFGCGYGFIALKAALAGADVTALDDDILAIRSTLVNAKNLGQDIKCLHSDVNSDLVGQFDVVLMNPPFHMGKQVRLELPSAFIAAAYQHLNLDGELILVANKALGYEVLLEDFSSWHQVSENRQFKVLRAIK